VQNPNEEGSVTETADPKTSPSDLPDFAPLDPLDGRDRGQWRSRFPKDARTKIRNEAIYLGLLLAISPLLMVLLNAGVLKNLLGMNDDQHQPLLTYGLAALGGLLGGTLFDIKWLYHTVARTIWHEDRIYWRIFTPHISAGLAFAMVALISSGVIRIFDPAATQSKSLVVGVSFLVGYFSDSAVAKLTEIAQTIFGSSRDREKHRDQLSPHSEVSEHPFVHTQDGFRR
jgi:hypothetical protein